MTTQTNQLNGSGDPVPSEDVQMDELAARGQGAPADGGVGANDALPSIVGGVYTPSSMTPDDPPEAGDVDPGSTASSTAQGMQGNTNESDKHKGFSWNG